jgi:hypothetical protein
MNHKNLSVVALILATCTLTWRPAELRADDPLKAFPTAENSAADRVKRLNASELRAIKLPGDKNQLVFSMTVSPPSEGPQDAAAAEPWLRVFADGRIDCSSHDLATERRDDKLTKDELLWLLHLAVNECQLLTRSTKDIETAYKKENPDPPPKDQPQRNEQYHVNLPSGTNDLILPEWALILRPLRGQMKLGAFSSLHTYARHLAARPFLGTSKERQELLDQLNARLKAEKPDLPPFRMEHLGSALQMKGFDLVAGFEQEIELEPNKFKRVMGTVMRKQKGMPPEFLIRTMDFSKYRP